MRGSPCGPVSWMSSAIDARREPPRLSGHRSVICAKIPIRGCRRHELLLEVFNFAPEPRHNYRVGVPRDCYWKAEAAAAESDSLSEKLAKPIDRQFWSCRVPLVKSCTLHCPHCILHIRKDHIGLQKAFTDSPRSFPRLISFCPQVVNGGALVAFSRGATSR